MATRPRGPAAGTWLRGNGWAYQELHAPYPARPVRGFLAYALSRAPARWRARKNSAQGCSATAARDEASRASGWTCGQGWRGRKRFGEKRKRSKFIGTGKAAAAMYKWGRAMRWGESLGAGRSCWKNWAPNRPRPAQKRHSFAAERVCLAPTQGQQRVASDWYDAAHPLHARRSILPISQRPARGGPQLGGTSKCPSVVMGREWCATKRPHLSDLRSLEASALGHRGPTTRRRQTAPDRAQMRSCSCQSGKARQASFLRQNDLKKTSIGKLNPALMTCASPIFLRGGKGCVG